MVLFVAVAPIRFNLVPITFRHHSESFTRSKCLHWNSSHGRLIFIVAIRSPPLICLIIPNSSGKYFTFINLSALMIFMMYNYLSDQLCGSLTFFSLNMLELLPLPDNQWTDSWPPKTRVFFLGERMWNFPEFLQEAMRWILIEHGITCIWTRIWSLGFKCIIHVTVNMEKVPCIQGWVMHLLKSIFWAG